MHRQALLLAILSASAMGSVPEWGQCGGLQFTGETDCATGFACVELNPYYSQCLAGTATTTVTTPTTTPTMVSTTSTIKSTSTTTHTTTTASSPPSATGFIKTSGMRFTLNGQQFVSVGSNAYWPALLGYSDAEIDQAFSDIAGSGATVCRAFNEVTSPQGVYFHLWTGSTATVNTGTDGLQRLDCLISSAKSHGIKFLIALSVTRLLHFLQPRTEPKARSKISCFGMTSAFIKSLNPNHLVAIGDEGFINDPIPHNFDFPYQGGGIGIDFEANLAVNTLDFGTFHDSWGESGNDIAWGQQWITDHAAFMTSANKPVIMEEFGLTFTGTQRANDYTTWYNTVISTGLTGDLLWQAGSVFNGTETPNDGYAIYPTDPVYTLLRQHAAALKARG
ncbi:glycoside hydrolase superfamily [Mycena metata]|uniref:mannan endo-1,4-beta-mannosidase n=1 Tax=Mycena metata TaxID=1033252 RepID=A0AAD7JZ60_9AGAR|nr:glycoside hydrolase superfamily [Mycena metata]